MYHHSKLIGRRTMTGRFVANHFQTLDNLLFEEGHSIVVRTGAHQQEMDEMAAFFRSHTREDAEPELHIETDTANYPQIKHVAHVFGDFLNIVEVVQ